MGFGVLGKKGYYQIGFGTCQKLTQLRKRVSKAVKNLEET